MRSLGGYLYLLALAVWVGGGALYTFVLTPAIFGTYPRNTAGDVVGTMMPYYFTALLAACAALLAPACLAQPAWKPERTVEIVVGSAPGGGNDKTGRTLLKIW